jgi:hypothetical protein
MPVSGTEDSSGIDSGAASSLGCGLEMLAKASLSSLRARSMAATVFALQSIRKIEIGTNLNSKCVWLTPLTPNTPGRSLQGQTQRPLC